MLGLLLGGRARLHPLAGLKVELIPPHGEDLAGAGSGQEQQADDVGCLLVGEPVERDHEARKLVGLEVALPLDLLVPLDVFAGIAVDPAPHLPRDRQAEHLAEQREHAIRAIGSALGDLPVQLPDVGAGDVGDLREAP